jgi:hypothetical protein
MATESYPPRIDRETLVARLAQLPPLETLMTADDLERQKMIARVRCGPRRCSCSSSTTPTPDDRLHPAHAPSRRPRRADQLSRRALP